MSYAQGTKVPVDRSVAEIQGVLRRYGAEGFMFLEEGDESQIAFRFDGYTVRFRVRLPSLDPFRTSPAGRKRNESQARQAWDQEVRRRWRSVVLQVKAKLEAVASSDDIHFLDEFMAYVVHEDGRTLGEHLKPRLEEAKANGHMPRLLLPAPGGAS